MTQELHHLRPLPHMVHWGNFSAQFPAALGLRSGDRVQIDTVSGAPEELPPPDFGGVVREDLLKVHRHVQPGKGPHILSGPIWVDGAERGDTLEVRILSVELLDDWGFTITRPLKGVLPELSEDGVNHYRIDKLSGAIETPWGLTLKAQPFFGIMAVAPAPERGVITTVIPDVFGGNMDCKELVAGTRLFLPVQAKGALFSVGDGHALQGDGEVCLTAVETGLRGEFQLFLRKDLATQRPYALTPTHLITMAFDEDLEAAVQQALDDMVNHVSRLCSLRRTEAYRLCSIAADVRISQLVNLHKGAHVMFSRSLLGTACAV